ncbi:MAG: lipopolysaccharide assembly protein LapA domain-containing protein [Pseudonocardiales bacterium]|jgi:uncharacterized integral membrane protein|nr:lipopolysaccharide assembly protein LapA domain-containing protein [Pseudonocardiales bacterium]
MSEDPTRATRSGVPAHGSVGPDDPHADPATDPALRAVGGEHDHDTGPVEKDPPTAPVRTTPDNGLARTRTGGLWTGLILSAIVLIFLLIFILQNLDPVRIQFLGLAGQLPTGVALLLAAVAGLLLVAIPGGLRILQLRRVAKRAGRA